MIKAIIILELAGFILFWCVGMLLRDKNDKYKYLRPIIFGLLWTPFCLFRLFVYVRNKIKISWNNHQ